MKTLRKMLVIGLCLCLVLSCASVSAFAADTGSITIENPSNSDATVAGKTFKVYKIFDATTSGDNTSYSWHKHDNGEIPFYDFFYGPEGVVEANKADGSIQKAVNYVVTEGEDNLKLSQLAEKLHAYIQTRTTPITPVDTVTGAASAESVLFDNLTYGYYLIYDDTTLTGTDGAVRSAVMLTSVNKDVTITLKANRPKILKQVLENDNTTWGKGTSRNIGDTVKFKITAPVPAHTLYTNYYYTIEDNLPAGLTLDGAIVVKYENTVLTEGRDYVSVAPGTGDDFDFKINLTTFMARDDMKAGVGNITVEYSAKVNENIMPQTNNFNTAKITYSNDPTKNDGAEPSVNHTIGISTDTANVYSYQFVFTKFAQDANGHFVNIRLSGAEFKLKRVEGGVETPVHFKVVPHGTGEDAFNRYVVAEAEIPGTTTETLVVHDKGEATITLTQNNYGGHLGDVNIFGLAEGTYYLYETKAPDGYLCPEEPFVITIVDEIDALGTVGSLDINGSHNGSGTILNTDGKAEAILTVWAEITNKPGSALPNTGGMGTTLFILSGIILMAGAAAFMFTRKRNNQAE